MKNILIIIVMMASLGWMACEKSSSVDETGIEGTWNLVAVSGGIAGHGYPAKFDAIRFDANTFDLLKNKASIYNGTYQLTPTASSPDSLKITSAPTDADGFLNIPEKGFAMDKNSLLLSDPCCDLFNYEFSRSVN